MKNYSVILVRGKTFRGEKTVLVVLKAIKGRRKKLVKHTFILPPGGVYFGPKIKFSPPPLPKIIFPPSRDTLFLGSYHGLFV
jgi:hypothetical protein